MSWQCFTEIKLEIGKVKRNCRYSDEPVQLLQAALLQLNNLEKTTVDTVYCKYGVGADGAVAKIGCAAQTIIVLHKPGG